jgi:hypothetical protein
MALERIARTGAQDRRELAKTALDTDNRWAVARQADIVENQVNIEQRVRLLSPDIQWTETLKRRVSERGACNEGMQCVLLRVGQDQLMLLTSPGATGFVSAAVIDLKEARSSSELVTGMPIAATDEVKADLSKARVEVRQEAVQRVYVDDKPVGPAVPISR